MALTPEQRKRLEAAKNKEADFAVAEQQASEEPQPDSFFDFEDIGSGIDAFSNSLSLGFGDEFSAGIGAVIDSANLGGDFSERYSAYKDADDMRRDEYAQNNPVWDAGLRLSGMIPPAIATGGSSIAAQYPRAAQVALGATEGFGMGDGANDSVAQAGIGALTAGVGSYFGEKLGYIMQRPATQRIMTAIDVAKDKYLKSLEDFYAARDVASKLDTPQPNLAQFRTPASDRRNANQLIVAQDKAESLERAKDVNFMDLQVQREIERNPIVAGIAKTDVEQPKSLGEKVIERSIVADMFNKGRDVATPQLGAGVGGGANIPTQVGLQNVDTGGVTETVVDTIKDSMDEDTNTFTDTTVGVRGAL